MKVNPWIYALPEYIPGKPLSLFKSLGLESGVKLASNENAAGPSPLVIAALESCLKGVHRYPDANNSALRQALARKLNVSGGMLTFGNGSNDVVEVLYRTFVAPGKSVVASQYAFQIYSLLTQALGARYIGVPEQNFVHDLDAILAAIDETTTIVAIVNPNNPTGTYVGEKALKNFIAKVPSDVIVILDEAYCEYVDAADYPDTTPWLQEFPNLVITRTFSKAYGLAGLRCGYAISSEEIATLLNRVRQPFSLNVLSEVAAVAALEDIDYLKATCLNNKKTRELMVKTFSKAGVTSIPSVGNFVTIDCKQDAKILEEALMQKGFLTRPLKNYGLPNFLRITTGSLEETERFCQVFPECFAAVTKVTA